MHLFPIQGSIFWKQPGKEPDLKPRDEVTGLKLGTSGWCPFFNKHNIRQHTSALRNDPIYYASPIYDKIMERDGRPCNCRSSYSRISLLTAHPSTSFHALKIPSTSLLCRHLYSEEPIVSRWTRNASRLLHPPECRLVIGLVPRRNLMITVQRGIVRR
jgi:hypothetical protein